MEHGSGPAEPTADDQLRADEAVRMLGEYVPQNLHDDTSQVLRAFVDWLPVKGQRNMVTDIFACGDDGRRLRELRNFVVDAVLKPMKTSRARGITATATYESSDVDARDEIEDLRETIEPSSRSEQSVLKEQCLGRDGFRCPVSGLYDRAAVKDGHVQVPAGGRVVRTECAHILPFSLRNFERNSTREVSNKATIWWALYRYFPSLRETIGPESMNQLQNVVTTDSHVHDCFGEFYITLDAREGGADLYHVTPLEATATTMVPPFPVGHIISLQSHNTQLPPPSPGFLEVHARLARILEVSGIGEKIARRLQLSYTENVASDGSTDLGDIVSRQLLTDV